MILSEKENNLLLCLSNKKHLLDYTKKNKQHPIVNMSIEEILNLYYKMDDIIKQEHEMRMELNDYDETYTLKLSTIKNQLWTEYKKRNHQMAQEQYNQGFQDALNLLSKEIDNLKNKNQENKL